MGSYIVPYLITESFLDILSINTISTSGNKFSGLPDLATYYRMIDPSLVGTRIDPTILLITSCRTCGRKLLD